MRISRNLMALAAGLLIGCATADTSASIPAEDMQQLTPRELALGECGLFVWSADAQKRFILFTKPFGEDAVWHDGGGVRPLSVSPMVSPGPEKLPAKQRFNAGYTELTLDLRIPQPIPQGMRYKGGVLKLKRSADGVETVMPVVGLKSCRY